MRKILYIICCVNIAAAALAEARHKHPYLRADGGLIFYRKSAGDNFHTHLKGPEVNIAYGFKTYCFRSELEGKYINLKSSDTDKITTQKTKMSFRSLAVFINVLADLTKQTVVTPYVGVGVGFAKNKSSNMYDVSNPSMPIWKSSTKNNVAFQAILGGQYKASKHCDITLDVKYLFLNKFSNTVVMTGEKISSKLRLGNITLGLKYNF